MEKHNGILKFTRKWLELEETILSEVTQSERDYVSLHILTHIWILDIKQKITSLQSTPPEKLGIKMGPKRDMHGPLEKGKGTRSPEQIGSMEGGERELREREGKKRRREEKPIESVDLNKAELMYPTHFCFMRC